MFGGVFFGKTYFGDTFFGPNVLITVVVRKKPSKEIEDSAPGSNDEYTIRTKKIAKSDIKTEKERILAQIMQEDEEIIAIIVAAIQSGII